MTQLSQDDLHAQAIAALQQGNWQQAHDISLLVLRQTPNHAGSCFVAGVAAMAMQQWTQALACLRQATQLEPTRGDFAGQFAKALSIANVHGEALRVANRTLCVASCDPSTLDTLGIVYTRANAHERASSVFRRAAAEAPDNPGIVYNYAMSLMYLGDVDAAQNHFEACLALDPQRWQAHYSVSRLRRQTAVSNHVARLQELAQRNAGDAAATMYLHMALGKEYEDLGDFPRAFAHFSQGKSAVSPTH
ncbi:MAG TPA: tetratricopeptide repeat protein, partial [Xanthomonadaceae bacterium]|nr:tetratricopeptide repeat protein [Xanthomonadaceae bacterium]